MDPILSNFISVHPIFRVSNLFRSFLPSIIFGDLSLKNKSVTGHNFLPPYVEFSGMKSNSYFRVICWYLRDATKNQEVMS